MFVNYYFVKLVKLKYRFAAYAYVRFKILGLTSGLNSLTTVFFGYFTDFYEFMLQ